ncbi:hypothetical protein [Actinomadura chokoriensis]|uniref:Uncharacterized protein n=1 Tax=Actinomadura chokoriensis TaxID=454156 RepID=A0ABV4R7H4_9ACTN
MDHDQARAVALSEFAGRGESPDEWEIVGPREETVVDLDGTVPCLVFDFMPRPEFDQGGRRFKLSIAVDPNTGEADMLR